MSNDPVFDLAVRLGKTRAEVEAALLSVGFSLTRTWPARADGRKAHYGDGKQPWDTALERGWAPHAAAFCVVRYLRRTKDPEHSAESAGVYYNWLSGLTSEPAPGILTVNAKMTMTQLVDELTAEELDRVMVTARKRV